MFKIYLMRINLSAGGLIVVLWLVIDCLQVASYPNISEGSFYCNTVTLHNSPSQISFIFGYVIVMDERWKMTLVPSKSIKWFPRIASDIFATSGAVFAHQKQKRQLCPYFFRYRLVKKKYVFLQIWRWGFQIWSQIFEKITRKHSKIAQKIWGCSTLPPHIQNLQKQIFLQPTPKCWERHVGSCV